MNARRVPRDREPAAWRNRIRLAEPGDVAGMLAIYGPIVRDTTTSFEIDPPGAEEFGERVSNGLARFPWLVVDDGGTTLGYAYGSAYRARAAYRWSCECSVYVATNSRRRGVGRALYRSLFAVLRLQGYCSVYAGITLPNSGSVALHEACGFGPVGVFAKAGFKFGQWHDVGWWQRRLQDPSGSPAEPTPLPQFIDSPDLAAALETGACP